MPKPEEVCDRCGRTSNDWTIVKTWELLCDPCMFKFINEDFKNRKEAEK